VPHHVDDMSGMSLPGSLPLICMMVVRLAVWDGYRA